MADAERIFHAFRGIRYRTDGSRDTGGEPGQRSLAKKRARSKGKRKQARKARRKNRRR